MLSAELSEEEVASIVIAAEGVLAEMSNLEQLSDEEDFQASVDALLEGETQLLCCQLARRVNSSNVEAATTLLTLLDIALSSEFRK